MGDGAGEVGGPTRIPDDFLTTSPDNHFLYAKRAGHRLPGVEQGVQDDEEIGKLPVWHPTKTEIFRNATGGMRLQLWLRGTGS